MGKLWDKVDDFVSDYPLFSIILFFFVLFVLIFLNLAFWSYFTPTSGCPNPSIWGCEGDIHLNLHGWSWTIHLFFSIIIIEIFFLLFCIASKREKGESSWYYTLRNKLCALGVWGIGYFIIIPLVWLFSVIPYYTILVGIGKVLLEIGVTALCIIGIIAVVGIYYLINVGLSKLFERRK